MHNVICPGAPGHQALQSLAPQGRHTTLLVAPPRSVARSLLSGTQGAESGVHARCGVACGVACARAVQKYILLIHVTFKDRAHFSGLEARAPCRDLELDQLHRVAARLRGVASASLVATLLLALHGFRLLLGPVLQLSLELAELAVVADGEYACAVQRFKTCKTTFP